MEFVEAVPVAFKEITPNHKLPDKWKEIVLNTGGTHSTLQDIKLPQKAGGYWYKESTKANTRNRFIYWQTTPDSIEFLEASLDINLSSANLRCKVAPGTPPLNGVTVWERHSTMEVVVLAATVSSVHRLVFPHPEILDKKDTFGSMGGTTPSVFYDTSSVNNPSNYHILNQYSNSSTGIAHTCASLLRDSGEAVFALAYGSGSDGGILLTKLPVTGSAVTYQLKKESTVPRFLSGLTGALRGKNVSEGIETYGIVITGAWSVAICGDACLRAWPLDDAGAPAAVSQPLSQTQMRPKPPPHGHMLQKATGIDGSPILVAFLSFPNECDFVAVKLHDINNGAVKFTTICRVFGPQLDLLDYSVGYGDGVNVIWALWSQPDGDTLITSSSLGAEVCWRAVSSRQPPPPLPQLPSHQHYQERLLAVGLFPPSVIRKALQVYTSTWGGGESAPDADLGEAASHAVLTRMRHHTARANNTDHSHLMHKCWSDLYSWCMQYMERSQIPLGIMVSQQCSESDSGWWCAVIRRAGISFVKELEPLERIMLSPDCDVNDVSACGAGGAGGAGGGGLGAGAWLVALAGARWERGAGRAAAGELEARVFACAAPQHRLLPRMLHLLLQPPPAPAPTSTTTTTAQPHTPLLTPEQIDELIAILEPIRDLQSAVLELNDALRLDVPDIDMTVDDQECSDYDNLLSSDLGVAVVTEAIRQMAEMRSRIVRGVLGALGMARGEEAVPGAGHCAVHWQAYRALAWLHAAPLTPAPQPATLATADADGAGAGAGAGGAEELFRLKLRAVGLEAGGAGGAAQVGREGRSGLVAAFLRGGAGGGAGRGGGLRARRHLRSLRAPLRWHAALPLYTHHVAHQLWAVSGGFEFGCWLATINRPKIVQNYVTLLEPWCERNACSRQFILGLALLDLGEAEAAYTAFCKAAKGVSGEPFLRHLVAAAGNAASQHQALVLYYMKVIKLFEIHDAGACVVRLAETAISIADKDDPNLGMFQWVVFSWHVSRGDTARALAAAAAAAPPARAAALASLLTHLAARGELAALAAHGALAGEAARAAATRAALHDAHGHNPYYDYLVALHVSRHHYRKAAAVWYERAARCGSEAGPGAHTSRRRCVAAALASLRLAQPQHAFIVTSSPTNATPKVIGVEDLLAELKAEDPDAAGPVQKALQNNDSIDFDMLYPHLKNADLETLSLVTKRALSTGQNFPHWFIERYMEVDVSSCIRSLAWGGRCVEAARACVAALRRSVQRLTAAAAPGGPGVPPAPLALADLLLAELSHHQHDPLPKQMYEDLKKIVNEYTDVVVRTSEDMKLAKIQFPITT